MSPRKFLILGIGLIWITINVFYLPFFAWTAGITRSWFMLHGYVPYRNFTWLRTPFDLFLLSGWFKFWGVGPVAYQFFIYTILIALALSVFYISQRVLPKGGLLPFLFYIIFLFPLFLNTDMGELLVGLWALLLFGAMFSYLHTGNLRLLLLSGIISGTTLMTKQNSGGLIVATLGIICFDAYRQKKSFSILIKRCAYYFIGLLIPTSTLLGYLNYHQALKDFFYYAVGVVLSPYRQTPLPSDFSRGDALWIEAGYIVLLIPFLLFWRRTGLSPQKTALITLFIVALYPSLLPSFLSYRAFTAYPLVAILAGHDMLLLKIKQKKFYIILSFILFIIFSSRFIYSYILSIKNEGIRPKNFIRDYGEPEYKTVEWIKNNTHEEEKIMSFTSEIIYFLSNRFPKNKYLDPIPVMLFPYDQSSQVFINDQPRIMVFDEALLQDFPDLTHWPFYQYLQRKYTVAKRFDTLVIYQLLPRNN